MCPYYHHFLPCWILSADTTNGFQTSTGWEDENIWVSGYWWKLVLFAKHSLRIFFFFSIKAANKIKTSVIVRVTWRLLQGPLGKEQVHPLHVAAHHRVNVQIQTKPHTRFQSMMKSLILIFLHSVNSTSFSLSSSVQTCCHPSLGWLSKPTLRIKTQMVLHI